MAIYANGPGTQTATITTTSGTVTLFSTTATGLTGTLKNVTVFNAGTITAYIGGGTAVSVAGGLPLAAGQQLLLEGTAINLYALTSSGTTVLVAGLATQSTVD